MSILNRPGWANRPLLTEAKKAYGGLNALIFNLLDKDSVENAVYVKNIILNNLLNNQEFKDFLSEKGVDVSNPEFHKNPDVVGLAETEKGKEFIKAAFNAIASIFLSKEKNPPRMIDADDSKPESTISDEPQSSLESKPIEAELSSTQKEPTAPPTSDSNEEFGSSDKKENAGDDEGDDKGDDEGEGRFEIHNDSPEENSNNRKSIVPTPSEVAAGAHIPTFDELQQSFRERPLSNGGIFSRSNLRDPDPNFTTKDALEYLASLQNQQSEDEQSEGNKSKGNKSKGKKTHSENKKPSPQEINRLLQENYIKSKQHKFNIEERYRF